MQFIKRHFLGGCGLRDAGLGKQPFSGLTKSNTRVLNRQVTCELKSPHLTFLLGIFALHRSLVAAISKHIHHFSLIGFGEGKIDLEETANLFLRHTRNSPILLRV